MIIAMLLALAAPPDRHNCAPKILHYAETLSSMWSGVGRLAGLSQAGQSALVEYHRRKMLNLNCPVRPESDVARDRLLTSLAAKQVDQAELDAARKFEIEARVRDEARNVDQLIGLLQSLSADDRQKLARFLSDDVRRTWAKRERLTTPEE